jgi:hypothetical protein
VRGFLVVDSDAATRTLVVGVLRRQGYSVLAEAEGEWALARIEFDRPRALVLGDRLVDLPATDVLARAREHGMHAAVLHSDPDPWPGAQVLGRPVDLDALLDWAATVPRTDDDEDEGPPTGFGGVPWSGSLTEHSFSAIYGAIAQEAFTGAVLLRHQAVEKVLEFAAGVPARVRSNLYSESLGQLLVREGKVGDADVELAMQAKRRSGTAVGDALIEQGFLPEPELESALERQMEERLFESFGWSEGSFRIRRGPVHAGRWSMDPFATLVEGARRTLSTERLLRRLADDRVLEPRQPLAPLPRAAEWAGGVDGRRSGRMVVDGLSREGLLHLHAALHLGWVRFGARPSVALDPALRQSVDSRLEGEMQRILKSRGGRPRPLDAEEAEKLSHVFAEVRASLEPLDAYGVLGVAPGATVEQIRSGYARASRSLDPARWLEGRRAPWLLREAERNHLRAVRALHILTNPESREAYDVWRADPESDRVQVWQEGRAKAALAAAATESHPSLPVDAYFPRGAGSDPEIDAERAYRRAQADPTTVEEALRTLEEALQADPQSAWIRRRWAQLLEVAGRVEEARPAFESALALDPNDPELRAAVQRHGGPDRPGLVQKLSRVLGSL